MPINIDKIEVFLDFHIFDILDFDLLLGYPLERLLTSCQGSLDNLFRETASATTSSCSENIFGKAFSQAKPPRDDDAHISVRIIRAYFL